MFRENRPVASSHLIKRIYPAVFWLDLTYIYNQSLTGKLKSKLQHARYACSSLGKIYFAKMFDSLKWLFLIFWWSNELKYKTATQTWATMEVLQLWSMNLYKKEYICKNMQFSMKDLSDLHFWSFAEFSSNYFVFLIAVTRSSGKAEIMAVPTEICKYFFDLIKLWIIQNLGKMFSKLRTK